MTPKLNRFLILLAMGFLLIPPLLSSVPPAAAADEEIRLRDGDSFVLGNGEFRLWGIDAPEFFQRCTDKAGQDYPCGRQAKDFLDSLIAGHAVRCEAMPKKSSETRMVAKCFADEIDLGRAMVRGGWALEYKYFSKGAYTADELEAKNDARGIWQGFFQNPREWRKSHENRH